MERFQVNILLHKNNREIFYSFRVTKKYEISKIVLCKQPNCDHKHQLFNIEKDKVGITNEQSQSYNYKAI